jgi:phosphoesterase RecJ-like protein
MKSLEKIIEFIHAHDCFVLSTHSAPDADGLGSQIVLRGILLYLGKQVRILNTDPVPARFAFLDPSGFIECWNAKLHQSFLAQSGLFILDASDEFNLGVLQQEALPIAQDICVIDHHELSPFTGLRGYIDTNAAATAEIIIELCQRLKVPITLDMANAAYAGLIYDTGSFIYIKTSVRTFKTALRLVQAGVVPYEIYKELFESAPVGALLLKKQVLSTLELHEEGKIAIQMMTRKDLEQTGATYEDAEDLINIPLQSRTVEVSILIKENSEGLIRCSLRSKGKVNVSLLAQSFGGGGHKTAAGFKSSSGLEETKTLVLQRVISAMESL